MAKSNRQNIDRRSQSSDVSPHETSLLQWVVSFLFWGQLLLAGSLYGSVAMAPKLARYVELNDEYVAAQTQLVRLEQQVLELRKITESLERDPSLLEELARIDLDATRPGEEQIPLQDDLTLQSRISTQRVTVLETSIEWYLPLLMEMATDRQLRTTSLLVAAVLVLVAFTFFQPSQAVRFSTGWQNLRYGSSSMLRRYRAG
ncbi:MAG: septum formation initiator family protein [Planctomycetota bacterium]|nr:septum formation initiator family protein [Planctomycetota bacterium]MDA1162531.1 septum formation initiator family protein [Planctomycetota bacterium]